MIWRSTGVVDSLLVIVYSSLYCICLPFVRPGASDIRALGLTKHELFYSFIVPFYGV
jgi:hypothetical protein